MFDVGFVSVNLIPTSVSFLPPPPRYLLYIHSEKSWPISWQIEFSWPSLFFFSQLISRLQGCSVTHRFITNYRKDGGNDRNGTQLDRNMYRRWSAMEKYTWMVFDVIGHRWVDWASGGGQKACSACFVAERKRRRGGRRANQANLSEIRDNDAPRGTPHSDAIHTQPVTLTTKFPIEDDNDQLLSLFLPAPPSLAIPLP